MKHWVQYIAVLVLIATLPFKGTDIAKLAPVEVVWLTEENSQVYLQTDTGDIGMGKTVEDALANMKATALGTIFLETADYLVVKMGREDLVVQVYNVLRPSCMVCAAEKLPDMKSAAQFLAAHEPQITLRQYRAECGNLAILAERDGRFEWLAQ